MKKLFLILLLASCASPNIDYNSKKKIIDFDNDLTLDEYSVLLIKYAEISSYPNLD